MIFLTATNHTLELQTSTTSGIDVYVSYVDITTSGGTPWDTQASITTVTTTTILSAPASSTQRQIKMISLNNSGTASNTITVKKDVWGTEYTIWDFTLKPWEAMRYVDGSWFSKKAKNGEIATTTTTDYVAPIDTQSFNVLKVGATTEAAWVLYSLHASTGTPWAFTVGTPWINGRATDGTTETWCIPVKNPSTGRNYITSYTATSTTASTQMLIDLLWINTGIAVATTTAQAITSATLPARDRDGTTNGYDVQWGILVTTATTNAGAIANTTLSYTDSDGNAWATATISSFPATAVAWTLVPFQLAAWDTGIRSVQSITLGTSYGGGAISLIAYRVIAAAPVLVANAWGTFNTSMANINIRLYNGVCLLPVYMPTATTATNVNAFINIEEK